MNKEHASSRISVEEQNFLAADRATLLAIIASIPLEDVIDRASFEARLRKVEQRLATATPATALADERKS